MSNELIYHSSSIQFVHDYLGCTEAGSDSVVKA